MKNMITLAILDHVGEDSVSQSRVFRSGNRVEMQQAPVDFFYQGSLKKSQSKSAWKFSIKVRSIRISFSITIMIAMKNFQSPFGVKIAKKVCPEFFN